MKVREALAAGSRRLDGSSLTPRLDAELLMAHALDVVREHLLLAHLDEEAPASFEPLLRRRQAGEPIAYIIGRRAFWTIELEVGPGALIPRPDSETLIEAAVAHFRSTGPGRILDLGTGPGTLLLAALSEWPTASGVGIDRSEEALALARGNALRLGLSDRAEFRPGDWTSGVEERFDLILCNPPYVEEGADLAKDVSAFEPHGALFAGPDGLDDYRRLAPAIEPVLAHDGIACIEIGAGQEEAVCALFAAEGFEVRSRSDLAGHTRCLILRH